MFSRIPKPVLFGLFGAVGCLLAALVLGEPLWSALAPPPPPPPEPVLQASASSAVVLFPGTSNTINVRVERDHFDGPVSIRLSGLPEGVEAADAVVPAKSDDVDVTLEASDSAAPATVQVNVVATTKEPKLEAGAKVELEIREPPRAKVDVVFVLDVTGSMEWAINGVRDGILDFVGELQQEDLDARVGLIAYRDFVHDGQYALEVLEFNGERFTSDYGAFRREVGQLIADGGGDDPESALNALAEVAQLDFRQDATRVVLLITDVWPRVPDTRIASMSEVIGILRNANITQVHGVLRAEDFQRHYDDLLNAFQGKHFDLESVAGGQQGFVSALEEVSRNIAAITVASRPATELTPSETAAAPVIPSLQSSQEFDAGSQGQLLGAVAAWTAALAIGVSVALVIAQNLSLRKGVGSAAGLALALFGGLAAGAAGGAAGQLLFQLSPGLDALFRIVGWALLGALVGVAMTFFVPNFKFVKGLVGGLAGGAVGAAGFLLALQALSAIGGGEFRDVAGRLTGAGLLGLCLGLMVALAERAFRSAWLEVRFGRLETVQVNLGSTPVLVGSDRQCTIYASEAPPVAWKFSVEEGKLVGDEVPTGARREFRAGDSVTIGKVTVTFRTSSAESAPTKSAAPPPPPPPPGARSQPAPPAAKVPPAAAGAASRPETAAPARVPPPPPKGAAPPPPPGTPAVPPRGASPPPGAGPVLRPPPPPPPRKT